MTWQHSRADLATSARYLKDVTGWISYRLIRETHLQNYVIYDMLTVFFFFFSCLAVVSIFTLKEVQLQRDPGYRNTSYPESGEEHIARNNFFMYADPDSKLGNVRATGKEM